MAAQNILYAADLCPFAQRAWIAILEKKVPFEWREVNLVNKSADFLEANPAGTVPAFVGANGDKASESLELARYLEDEYPQSGNPLLPASSIGKYHVNVFLKKYDGDLFRPFYGALLAQDKAAQDTNIAAFEKILRQLDADLGARGGPFFLGEQFTLADLSVFPFIERSRLLLAHYRGYEYPKELTNLAKWYDAVAARPSVAETISDRKRPSLDTQIYQATKRSEYLIEVYHAYATNTNAQFREANKDTKPPHRVAA